MKQYNNILKKSNTIFIENPENNTKKIKNIIILPILLHRKTCKEEKNNYNNPKRH